MKNIILLTGRPGCGKTTIIKRIIPDLPKPVDGFYTQEIRHTAGAHGKGIRLGFELITLDGHHGILAHVDPKLTGGKTTPRIGRYFVSLRTMHTLAVPSLQNAVVQGGWAVVDEIGPMELLSESFHQTLETLLSSEINILGSIVQRSTPLGDLIKARSDVTLIELLPQRRDEVYTHIRTLIAL